MDQGSTRKRSAVHNFAPTVTKFCVMWEGLSLPHDTKFGNSRCEIVGRRVIFIWSLIHGLRWSGLIKVGPALILVITRHMTTHKTPQPRIPLQNPVIRKTFPYYNAIMCKIMITKFTELSLGDKWHWLVNQIIDLGMILQNFRAVVTALALFVNQMISHAVVMQSYIKLK